MLEDNAASHCATRWAAPLNIVPSERNRRKAAAAFWVVRLGPRADENAREGQRGPVLWRHGRAAPSSSRSTHGHATATARQPAKRRTENHPATTAPPSHRPLGARPATTGNRNRAFDPPNVSRIVPVRMCGGFCGRSTNGGDNYVSESIAGGYKGLRVVCWTDKFSYMSHRRSSSK